MPAIVRIKRSETNGNPAVLAAGELAYSSLTDNGSNGGDRLYIGTGTETAGNAVNHVIIGGKRYTDLVDAATSTNTNSTIVRRDASGNFSAGNITANLLGNATTSSKWGTSRTITLTGDLSGSYGLDGNTDVSASISLATTGVTAGTYGSGTQVPVITIDSKGRITVASTASISAGSSALSIAGNTGTDVVTVGTDTFSILGGTGVTTAVTNNTVTINLPQALGTTDNVTFNNVTVNGTLSSDDVTAASLTVTGNLTVQGTTTTVNSTNLAVSDVNITVAKDATNAASAEGAGLTVAGANATLTYTSGNDRWNFNKDLVVATVHGSLNGNSSTATTWATARNLSLTGDATATLSSVNGSANVSAALTLATVNSNVGSFGSATTIPAVTVNAKGLVTAVSTNNIPTATTSVLGLASFNSTSFSVVAGSVDLNTVDGGTY
jgi:hypothetical protein